MSDTVLRIEKLEKSFGELQVLKGVYVLAFDGVAAGADGTARRVRSAQYATMLDAVTLTADEATVTLKLLELQ